MSVPLPFVLTGGVLVVFSPMMILFAPNRVYAFVSFLPFLVAGILLLCLGPVVVAAARRSS
ncbi:MAG: hypothetical protein M3426_02335 [Actinomycetota bacterium]|nr:hypothetical protein [Actinomycetota bacterium]